MKRKAFVISISISLATLSLILSFRHAALSNPTCYIDLGDGQVSDLEHLCDDNTNPQLESADAQTLADMNILGLTATDIEEIEKIAKTQNSGAAAEHMREILCLREPEGECNFSRSNIYVDVESE